MQCGRGMHQTKETACDKRRHGTDSEQKDSSVTRPLTDWRRVVQNKDGETGIRQLK